MKAETSFKNWVVRGGRKSGGASTAQTQLFCFHSAGGSASQFHNWDAHLPGITTLAWQLPGRDSRLRDPVPDSFAAAVDEIVESLRPIARRPFFLFGNSLGALLAFEAARALQRHGTTLPQGLLIAAAAAPAAAPVWATPISQLPDDDLLAEIRRSGTVPEMILRDTAIMQFIYPLIRADFKLLESYVFEGSEPLAIPIVAYGGMSDSYVSPCALSAWSYETSSSFRCRYFPGDHYFLKSASELLLADVQRELSSAERSVSGNVDSSTP